ncbi:hypothetical protein [Pedobacter sp. JCM 36344]|uniref:hypothetical protein n=1 Tax=Pedobacter sp. JCM 36344 TaxID=3374280 RepID=UPI00397C06A8
MSEQITPQLRLRVFAGPNGSGKSTVIKRIRETEVNETFKLDLGVYINADDIAQSLKTDMFFFHPYEVNCKLADLVKFGETSGLLSDDFSVENLVNLLKFLDANFL